MCPLPNSSSGAGSPASSPAHPDSVGSAGEYSPDERELLLHLAHQAVESALEEREPALPTIPEHLKQQRGAFTTLYLEGDVRGCVGYVFAVAPLFQTVIETARAAAFQDMRFLPVTREEAAQLRISISVLSPLFPIKAEELELGNMACSSARATAVACCCPRCLPSTVGTARPFWSRPAARPAWRRMRGSTAPRWKPSLPKFSVKASYSFPPATKKRGPQPAPEKALHLLHGN